MRTRMSGGVGGGLMPPYPDLPDLDQALSRLVSFKAGRALFDGEDK